LSLREIDIVKRLMHGESNKQISRLLDISETTVKVHVKAILRKIRRSNRTQAAIWGLDHFPAAPGTGPSAMSSEYPVTA
jgi:two-component system nitrate/nitrite response regulator NarL